ncbi:hypothetical protein CC2G_010945 [Coprinopsis cinerea AmutBmut pab1-1]|nr:hypothetical protein CC2G_010945 [Coprinopsis cinerea AmutBmut pab1-1]
MSRSIPSFDIDKSQTRVYKEMDEYLQDARSSDMVIPFVVGPKTEMHETPLLSLLCSEKITEPFSALIIGAIRSLGQWSEGRRIIIVPVVTQAKWRTGVIPTLLEFLDKSSGIGFPEQSLRAIYLDRFLHRTSPLWEASALNRVQRAVIPIDTWGDDYAQTYDNRVLEKKVEGTKQHLMKCGLGEMMVKPGWHVASLYPLTSEKAWQIIEFVLSDKDYVWDPIFRFPRGYVWKEGDDLSFK